MKTSYTLVLTLLSLFSHAQESIFSELNKKGFGTFEVTAQYFFMHRTNTNFNNDTNRHDNSGTVAFTFNYETPTFKNFSLKLSYLETQLLSDYYKTSATIDDNRAEKKVQNDAFRFLNNISLNYDLSAIGLEGGRVVIGRFPLDMEYMTRYPIRQKEQAYEGVYVEIPSIGNMRLKAGHITQFSSWTTNEGDIEFKDVALVYESEGTYTSSGHSFVEATYSNTKKGSFLSTYYNRFHQLSSDTEPNTSLNVIGWSSLQKIIPFSADTFISFRKKGTIQWGAHGNTYAIQPALMFTYDTFSVEAGLFSVDGSMEVQNPFGGRWIAAEPLFEIDFQRKKDSDSYYIETSYRFAKGKIYGLYTRSVNTRLDEVFEEYNIITAHEIGKRLNAAIKLALFKKDSAIGEEQLLDARLVLNYTF
ncbi:MAG: hypothetical protein AAF617_13150 [Bacteroidota bacterium]